MPEKDIFRLKQFSVSHSRSLQKVTTDSIILGSLIIPFHRTGYWLDIGAGCGILSLMAAQKNPSAIIHAIEPDENSFLECEQNFMRSPWSERLVAYQTALQNFKPNIRYDGIVCNPPYFHNGLLSKKVPDKNSARHQLQLTFEEVLQFAVNHLHPQGSLWTIYPIDFPVFPNIYKCRLFKIVYKPNNDKTRYVTQWKKQLQGKPNFSIIHVFDEQNKYTEEYLNITGDFLMLNN